MECVEPRAGFTLEPETAAKLLLEGWQVYAKGPTPSVIFIACTGHWISHARQNMQSRSRIGSAFQRSRSVLPLSLAVCLSIFSCSAGKSILSKTLVGQTEMQMPSAMQMSKSTPTATPCTPYSLLTPSFHLTSCPSWSSFLGHSLGKEASSIIRLSVIQDTNQGGEGYVELRRFGCHNGT